MPSPLTFGDELRAEPGTPRSSRSLDSSPRSRVWRVELPERTAVVKQAVDGPDTDERYAREVAAPRLAGRAGWLLRGDTLVQRAHRDGTDHLARIPDEDWEWGTATARQRLAHRLGVVNRMTTDHTSPSEVSGLTADMRERMPARWPTLRPVPTERPWKGAALLDRSPAPKGALDGHGAACRPRRLRASPLVRRARQGADRR
ncbi:hypothetical protein [Streptomyces sp. P9-A4]|uniref:hypothetical protein n=1 Tax=Streptomyces sp. P9-A4 TaxID=3072285 RepID=UPI002FC74DCA